MNIILIIGLPASGKSTYAKIRFPDAVLVDDPISFDDLPEEKVDHLVIIDPFFCIVPMEMVCKKLQNRYGAVEFSTIYFENNPEQCLKNAKRRDNKQVDAFIRQLSKDYDPPSCNLLKIWSE